MGMNEIRKAIKKYVYIKRIIIIVLIIDFIMFVVGLFSDMNQGITIVSYLLLILNIIIGYICPHNRTLSKHSTIDDYPGILDYLSEISDDDEKQIYFDGLVLIKNSLNEIVHYHGDSESYVLKNAFYLQGKFRPYDKNSVIPMELCNRTYLRSICIELKNQLDNREFDLGKLEIIRCKKEEKCYARFGIDPCDVCNIILIGIVILKFIFTINTNYYSMIEQSIEYRIFYNLGTDIIAVIVVLLKLGNSR